MTDNWKHRSDNMTCKTCMYFVLKQPPSMFLVKQDDLKESDIRPGKIFKSEPGEVKMIRRKEPRIGRCRRNAPTMNGFPVVFKEDWCGNHKLDEEKV